jgi:hypothetical protein
MRANEQDRPRTFEECVAASDPDEMARLNNGDCFIDPTAERDPEVYVRQDRYGEQDQVGNDEWRIEYMDSDGGCYVTTFAGPEAERRARDYFGAIKSGALKIVREGSTAH